MTARATLNWVTLAGVVLAIGLGLAVGQLPTWSGPDRAAPLAAAFFALGALAAFVLAPRDTARMPVSMPFWVWVLPVVALAVATTVFREGAGGVFPHQVAWAAGLLVIGSWLVATPSARFVPPAWLILFVGVGVLVAFASDRPASRLADIAFVGGAIWGMWLIAVEMLRVGGIGTMLGAVAAIFWAATGVAVLASYGHITLGTFGPATITLPWQYSFDANYEGWSFVSGQGGRGLAGLIVVVHLARWKVHGRWYDTVGALAAAVVLLSLYGRIPAIASLLAISITLATSRQAKTNFVALIAVAAVAFVGLVGVGTTGVVNLRLDQDGWDSGHLGIWGQQIGLFINDPAFGVGTDPDSQQVSAAQQDSPSRSTDNGPQALTQAQLAAKGSRGEGGWTGLMAQRGLLGSLLLGVVFAAFLATRRPRRPVSKREALDLILLRATLPASLILYVTDIFPLGTLTVANYVVAQVTIYGAVVASRRRTSEMWLA